MSQFNDYVAHAMDRLEHINGPEDFQDDPDGTIGVAERMLHECKRTLEDAFAKFHDTHPDECVNIQHVIENIQATKWSALPPEEAIVLIDELHNLLSEVTDMSHLRR